MESKVEKLHGKVQKTRTGRENYGQIESGKPEYSKSLHSNKPKGGTKAMDSNSGQTTSIWMATAEVPGKSPLIENTHSDVCIVGAGIAGMTTAYLLAREGRSVIVLDDGRIGGGMTERTTAHLSNASIIEHNHRPALARKQICGCHAGYPCTNNTHIRMR
ncbi:MAG: FAD-binding oxidoreductase, partial [Desulfosarcina sp.]